jgi:hypothetical protein
MIKQVTVLDVQDKWPEDIAEELRQIWENKRNADGASNGCYVKFYDELWDDYTAIPKYLAAAGLIPEDEILILIHW